ncbi:MAG: hypothetical protein PHD67_05310 [Oscillospiraceae bacterium]|nr:hypothetical protein [Oscillospiraceae bacterium]
MGQNCYDTRYFEKYAMLTLRCCYDPRWDSFVCGQGVESPDLQSRKLDIGVEVTRAITEQEGLAHRIVTDYFSRGMDEEAIEDEVRRRYPRFSGEVRILDGVAVLTSLDGLFRFKVHLSELAEAVEVKTRKLNQIYRLFGLNCLYIFTFTEKMGRRDIAAALAAAQPALAPWPRRYDRYFINCVTRLYVAEPDGEIEEIPLSPRFLSFIGEEALLP